MNVIRSHCHEIYTEEIIKIALSPVPIWLVNKLCFVYPQLVTDMVFFSFNEGSFPDQLNHAIARPRLEKPYLAPLDVKLLATI